MTVDDIITRLARTKFMQDADIEALCDEAAAEIKRLRAMLDAVDDLHDLTSVEDPRCASCGDYPCPTHLIVCDECREAHRG